MIKFTPSQDAYPRDELVRHGELEGGPVLTVSGTANGEREFRAMWVRIFLNPVNGAWVCRYAVVSGGLLKNDGTPGKVTGSREFSSPETSEDTPDWLRDVVHHLIPCEPAPSRQVEPVSLDGAADETSPETHR